MSRTNPWPVVVSIAVVLCFIGTGYLTICSEILLSENHDVGLNVKSPSKPPPISSNKRTAGDKGIYFVTGTIASYGYGNGQHSRYFIINTFDWLWPTHADSGAILIIWDHQGWSDGWRREMNNRGIQFTQKSAGGINANDFDPNIYRMIIISEYQPNQHLNQMESLVPSMEKYVNDGGILIDMFGTNYQRRWSRGVPGPFGVRTNGNGNSHNFVASVNHPMVRNMNRPSFSGSSASHGEITTIPLGSEVLLTVGQNQGGTPVACWLEVDLTAYTDNAAILGQGDGNNICYARHRNYTLSVNVTSARDLTEVSEVKVFLDYNTTNATLCYNWTQSRFYKYQDLDGHVQLNVDDSKVSTDGVERWWLNFSVIFNFTFPHEELVDCYISTAAITGIVRTDRFPHLFKVENDLELVGIPDLTGEYQGELKKNDWIRGRERIKVSNLKVRYAGAPDIYPDDDYFDVRVADNNGSAWWDNESMGENIEINITSGNDTDPEEEYLITIENIPGTGICMTNLTFPLRIDADPPLFPVNLKCHANDFKDKETEHTNRAEMFVTWDPVEDHSSGLMGYYYSPVDKSGTGNGTFTNVTEVKIEKLNEEFAEIYVWCVDKVGNIGTAASSGILVDLTPPVFSNHTPEDGSWHNHTDIDCSIEIYDGTGSGVDGSTIEYSVSNDGMHGFDFWIPAWIPELNEPMVPNIKYVFQEGEENYIKWRTKDITGNGFVESPSYNIKVDTTPINFAKLISPQVEWYDHEEITTKILVNDIGSGVNPDSLGARISTSSPNDFGRWESVDVENISESGEDGFEITVTFKYAEGKDNYIMFRGTDMVGNLFTLSDKFNLKIDTSPIYFGLFTPDENEYADNEKVECFIQILDASSGVDPATVEYSVANGAGGTGMGGDEKIFGPWKKVVNVVAGNPTQVLIELEFDWGYDNFIRWRADDMMGTGLNISLPYRVWVNSRPEAAIASPDPGSYFRFDSEITFDASGSSDEDGDNLSYYWSSNVSVNRSIGFDAYFSAGLAPGKHTITLFVSDRHGYNESTKVKLEVISQVDFQRDSDGDGFSDGLERESGSDPYNGAISPDGEPDIVISESGGILGGGSSLFFVILGIVLFLTILVLVIIFIVRRRKKDEVRDVSVPIRSPMPQSMYGPAQHPYPQGQFIPVEQKGYGEMAQYQAAVMGMRGAQNPPLIQSIVPDISNTQYSGPNQVQQTQPQQLALYGQSGTGMTGSTAYSLPLFSTDQGPQNLDRMALPPGPPPSEDQGMIGAFTPTQMTAPDLSAQPALLPGVSAMENPFQSPPAPIPLSGEAPPAPPEPTTISPSSTSSLVLGVPPIDTSADSDLSQLDTYLTTLGGLSPPPEPTPSDVPPVPEESPVPPTNKITMQCHSCGNNYIAEIAKFPALVTCTVCQTQGVIESI
ncbi:MAG: hypothetical protein QGH39_00275 [Candidatus Thermoplasmatota archaeon]|jgi:hypothetical protein|nr:hypothetical protein [Candidatus Thermoplasmatota archaeon]MDP7263977.1 hypothetical protein [Candidatus Thermoplasmatota archaeon]